MTQVAYALRADYQDTFQGGVIHVGDRDFDVAAELEKGGGYIVVDTAEWGVGALVAALDANAALKRTAVRPAAEAVQDAEAERVDDELDGLTKEQLLALPEADGIDGAKSMKVDELRKAVAAARKEA